MKASGRSAGVWVVGLVGIVLLAAGVAAYMLIPEVDRQLPPAPLWVRISLPLDRAYVPAGQALSVYVEADAAVSLAGMELYVDGQRLETPAGSSPLGGSSASAVWVWTPTAPGMYRLVARAMDASGQTGFSHPVRIFVLVAADPAATDPFPALDGSVASLADQDVARQIFDLLRDPAAIDFVALDAATNALEMQSTGQEAVSAAPLPVPPAPAPALTVGGGPSTPPARVLRFRLWWQRLIGDGALPAAPGLSGAVDECAVSLTIADHSNGEAGFRLWRLGPYDTDFQPVAGFDAQAGQGMFSYVDADLPVGNHQYYATSLNGQGEVAGNVINVEVSAAACEAANPVALSFETFSLTVAQPVDRLYCYFTLDEINWQRIPSGLRQRMQEGLWQPVSVDDWQLASSAPQAFILPENGVFDLAPFVGPLVSTLTPGQVFTLECWGWSGGTLVELGRVSEALILGPIEVHVPELDLTVTPQQSLLLPGTVLTPVRFISPPYRLHYPTDLQDCLAHDPVATSWACAVMEEAIGLNVIAWDWRPEGDCELEQNCGYNVAKIDGFHIYQVQPPLGEPVLIGTVPAEARVALVGPPSNIGGYFVYPEYYVRAYRGVDESADSNHLTVRHGQYRIVIPARVHSYLAMRVHKGSEPGSETVNDVSVFPNFTLAGEPQDGQGAGFISTGKAAVLPLLPPWFAVTYVYKYVAIHMESFFAFDLSQVQGNVTSARLQWTATGHWEGENGLAFASEYCRTYINDNTDTLVAAYPLALDGDLDVTAQVRAWLDGLAVYGWGLDGGEMPELPDGFWFMNGALPIAEPDVEVFEEKKNICFMRFDNVILVIESE